jgi:hypothetical protein
VSPHTRTDAEARQPGYVGEEARTYRSPEITINVEPSPAPNVVVNVPEQPAPLVTVLPAHVVPPQVDVQVNVPEAPPPIISNYVEAKAAPVQDVRIVDDVSPPKVKRVIRNQKGQIEGVVEGRPGDMP